MLSPKRANFAPCQSCQARATRIQSAEAVLHLGVRPMPDDHLAVEAQAGVDESRFAVAMCRLVEVHEIHVDLAPGQIAVELCVQVEERLPQSVQSADPHFRGRERVHPKNETRAVRVAARFLADAADFLRSGDKGFENEGERHFFRAIQRFDDFLRVGGDLLERFWPVEVL